MNLTAIILVSIFLSLLILFIIALIIGELSFKTSFSHKLMDEAYKEMFLNKENPYLKLIDFDFLNKEKHKQIKISTFDKTILNAYYYESLPSNHRYLIALHGYTSRYNAHSRLFKLLKEKYNFNLLLIDQRGHGESGGRYTTLGVKEQKDIVYWTKYIKKHDEKAEIILFGASFGAATALLGASLLSNDILGVIADSPYKDIEFQIKEMIKPKTKSYTSIALFLLNLCTIFLHHFTFKKTNIKEASKNIKVNTLILHSMDDNTVSFSQSKDIYDNLSNKIYKKRVTFKKGRHILSFIYENEKYVEEITDFIDKCLDI